MKKIVWVILYVLCIGLIIYSAVKLGTYYFHAYQAKTKAIQLAENVVVWEPESICDLSENGDETETAQEQSKIPQRINFDTLLQENEDVVAWLYCPDTVINYPVVQGESNDSYLRTDLKKEYSLEGTLFVEALNTADFSDFNTVIYGHNMKSGSMFHTITSYTDQEFYERHPVMYLYTPEKRYEIRLLGGCVIDSEDVLYNVSAAGENMASISQVIEDSTFLAEHNSISVDEHFITMSTCSYEYENARYVLVGKLIEW